MLNGPTWSMDKRKFISVKVGGERGHLSLCPRQNRSKEIYCFFYYIWCFPCCSVSSRHRVIVMGGCIMDILGIYVAIYRLSY